MLFNIVNWLYVLIIIFPIGYAFVRFVERALHYTIKYLDAFLVSGLIITTVYAEIWSLFGGVGMAANIVLLVLSFLCVVIWNKRLVGDIRQMFQDTSKKRKVAIVLLILAWAYFTSHGYFAYGSDLYHGQSIRWIEEYGVVKGLGNLHERFAYNSASFALSALFSMKFLLGRSLHTISGLWALLLSITALDVAHSFKRKKMILSDYARIAAIYYLITIMDEVVAPASDFAIMCMLFWIVIRWIDTVEAQRGVDDKSGGGVNITPYALLCVAGVYALTLKLTAGLILLLLIKPAYLLIKEKKWKEIVLYLTMGLAVAVPWFARTVLISGWLIYPFGALDLFDVDWKIHPQIVEVDAADIKVWARGLYDTALVDVPMHQWVGNWFRNELGTMEKLLILAALAGIVMMLFMIVRTIRCRKKENIGENLDYLLVSVTMIASYLFWQCSAPMVRYGYVYILLTAALPFGMILLTIGKDRVIYYLVLLYGAYKLLMIGDYMYDSRYADNYIWQAEYGEYQIGTYDVDGNIFYYSLDGDRTGYHFFPASPEPANIELRGDDLADGFRYRR